MFIEMLANKMQTCFSADMQYGGRDGGDLLFGEISNHQRSPGGRTYVFLDPRVHSVYSEFQPLFNTEFYVLKGNAPWQTYQ